MLTLKNLDYFEDNMEELETTFRYLYRDLNNGAANINYIKERPHGIHASELSSCLRKAQYTYLNAEKRFINTAYWSRILRIGEVVHNVLQEEFTHAFGPKNSKNSVTAETEVNINHNTSEIAKKYNIHGHADVVLTVRDSTYPNRSFKVLVEIKSASQKTFENMKSPKKEHIEQATLYMKCLDIPVGWILYWNKGDQVLSEPVRPFIFTFKQSVWNQTEQNIIEIINKSNLQPIEFLKREEGMHCKFCSYAHLCKPNILLRKKSAPDPF